LGATFEGATFKGATFKGATFKGATFKGAAVFFLGAAVFTALPFGEAFGSAFLGAAIFFAVLAEAFPAFWVVTFPILAALAAFWRGAAFFKGVAFGALVALAGVLDGFKAFVALAAFAALFF